MQLEMGRPQSFAQRLPKEQRVYELLDRLGICYWRVDHEPAMTMEICAGIEKTLQAPICKNLLLCNRQCTNFYLLLMPGDKNFRTSVLSKEIGSSRLSFASAEYMQSLLDITPGSLSILGLMNDPEKKVQLLIDADILKETFVGCHPCINTSSLKIETRDMLNVLIPALGHAPQFVCLPDPAAVSG